MEELIDRIVSLSEGFVQSEMYGLPKFAAATDPDAVKRAFQRSDAREFFTRFDPQRPAVVDSFWGDITFYSFAELAKMQIGYATDGRTGEPDEDWPKGMIAIAEASVDPIMLDPAFPGEIMFAHHGAGVWEPIPIAADIPGFLQLIIAWLDMVRQRGDEFEDETLAIRPESLELFSTLAKKNGVAERYVENILNSM